MSYHPGQSLIKEKETERTHILFMASESQKKKNPKIDRHRETQNKKTPTFLFQMPSSDSWPH
jgi:hypothetical protein